MSKTKKQQLKKDEENKQEVQEFIEKVTSMREIDATPSTPVSSTSQSINSSTSSSQNSTSSSIGWPQLVSVTSGGPTGPLNTRRPLPLSHNAPSSASSINLHTPHLPNHISTVSPPNRIGTSAQSAQSSPVGNGPTGHTRSRSASSIAEEEGGKMIINPSTGYKSLAMTGKSS